MSGASGIRYTGYHATANLQTQAQGRSIRVSTQSTALLAEHACFLSLFSGSKGLMATQAHNTDVAWVF